MNIFVPANKKGFTLLEILIVLGLLSLLFAFISSPLLNFYRKIVFQGAVENVLTMLDEARKSTLSSYFSQQYGVHLSSTTVTLFQGSTYSAIDPNNDIYELNAIVEITDITILGGGDDVVFSRITGETPNTGTITITPLTGSTSPRTVTIYGTGLVEINE